MDKIYFLIVEFTHIFSGIVDIDRQHAIHPPDAVDPGCNPNSPCSLGVDRMEAVDDLCACAFGEVRTSDRVNKLGS